MNLPSAIPPGSPIVSGCACTTTQIFRFFDEFHRRPLIENSPSYIQDTTHFLPHNIDNLNHNVSLPPNNILYTDIDQDEGLNACKSYLKTCPSPDPPPLPESACPTF